jgi:hypothetical protein
MSSVALALLYTTQALERRSPTILARTLGTFAGVAVSGPIFPSHNSEKSIVLSGRMFGLR